MTNRSPSLASSIPQEALALFDGIEAHHTATTIKQLKGLEPPVPETAIILFKVDDSGKIFG